MNNTLPPNSILQTLIRFDTTNPPGNEGEAALWAKDILSEAGIPASMIARHPDRPNLIARLPGQGNAPPLLLYGHLDVVTTQNQSWQHPPFGGELIDGYVWGRGALDMKGGVAMMMAALLRAKAENAPLPGDVILTLVADEEAGGDFGAKFLVEEHPQLFEGVRHALGEFGGFTLYLAGRRFYPIMVAEKQLCMMRAILRGPGGHGSMIHRGGAMAKLARFLQALDHGTLPVHITPALRQMMEGIAGAVSAPLAFMLRQLLNPALTDFLLTRLKENNKIFEPLFHNTVNATIVQGGEKFNVIPSEISVALDGRLLPGFTPADMLSELHALVGDEVEIVVERHDPGPAEPDMSLFPTLSTILREADPGGHPIPLLLVAVTDARFFSRLGIQTYGFLPMQLPPDFDFSRTIHAADERIPAKALDFGTQAIFQAMLNFGG